jgi:hypothetical protein
MSLPGVLDPWREVIHPAALILPRPSDSEYADLKASIESRGMLTPVATFIDKKGEHWLLDGVSRLQVLVEMNQEILDNEGRWAVPTTPYYEEKGDDPYEIALSLNVVRRHLTPAQKREVIRQLREERPDLTDRAIARMAGVSHHTVADEREQEEETQTAAAGEETVTEPRVDPETGEVIENENVTHISRGVVQEPRTEVSGRRARGRQPGVRRPRAAAGDGDTANLPTVVFTGTVLPQAPKAQRVAEAKRCLKHLGLSVADLTPRGRRNAA